MTRHRHRSCQRPRFRMASWEISEDGCYMSGKTGEDHWTISGGFSSHIWHWRVFISCAPCSFIVECSLWYLLCIATTTPRSMPSHQMGLSSRCPSRGRCRELTKVRTIRVSAMVWVFSVDNFHVGRNLWQLHCWWEDDLESYLILYNLI